jgi:hypothetical protein
MAYDPIEEGDLAGEILVKINDGLGKVDTAVSADEGNLLVKGTDELPLLLAAALPPSGAAALALRHDWASPYSYCGTAPADTLDAAEAWTITRIELSAAGAVVATLTASGVAWDDRLTATYA